MLPHIQRQRNKNRRRKALLKQKIESRSLESGISKTQQKRTEREQQRDAKKAEHKLAFFDRLFGLGRGPVKLRSKWMAKLLGRGNA